MRLFKNFFFFSSSLACSLKSYDEALFLFTGRLKIFPNFYSIFKSEYIFERHCKIMVDFILRDKLAPSNVCSKQDTNSNAEDFKLEEIKSFHFKLKISEEDFNEIFRIMREVLVELNFGGECLKQMEERISKVKGFIVKRSLFEEMGGNRGNFLVDF